MRTALHRLRSALSGTWALLHVWDDTDALYPRPKDQDGVQRGAIAYRDPGNLSGF